jgi:NADPH:quinone reductase-like Zn-dependent oxidoreductase
VDAVGGETASALVRSLGLGGRLLLYGTLSGEPVSFDPRVLMVNRARVEGFWLSNWSREQRPLTMLRLFRQLNRLIGEGVLTSQIAASFPLDQICQAVDQAETPGRTGKILLRMSPSLEK